MSRFIGLLFTVLFLCAPCSVTKAQPLNDLVLLWLAQNGKVAAPGDYATCQVGDQPESMCSWNAANLGPQPKLSDLQALDSAWQAQQAAIKQYAAIQAIGSVQVTSAGTPSLSGQYGIAVNDKINISAVIAGIAAGQGLPGSQSTFIYFDANRQPHTFTAAQFQVFAQAIRDYVYGLALAALGQGVMPSGPVTLP